MKPKIKTETVLTILKILAWIAFFGFAIQTTMYIISYIISFIKPKGTWFAFDNLNLYGLKEQNFLKYTLTIVLLVVLTALKANIWYQATQIIQNIKIQSPFTMEITRRLEKISYFLLYIWILGYVGSTFSFWLTNQNEIAKSLHEGLSSKEFLFMAGLLFIVSQIFKRGVKLQSENDLTV
ncbi:DUF2975 domain-containing protein [Maribellus maritimus]|uniref:DUF2975 domain-containing protein n=1 Tax=Maribellus maritimus TaxID=2870838 RepID=UPI001EEB01F3|nr:DUF2975 domain-containing protein [Maribellus maritimus]MCG6190451.1 DUF2975 domain-containing protein [Maribellus maritimus]